MPVAKAAESEVSNLVVVGDRLNRDAACPLTTLCWDFLARHEQRLAKNPRMALQLKNVGRLAAAERATIAEHAARILAGKVGAA